MKNFKFLVMLLSLILVISACGDDKPKNKPKANPIDLGDSSDKPADDAVKSDPLPPEQLAKAKEIIAGASDADVSAADGKKLYKTYCAACHGFDGKLAVNGAKDLTKSTTSLEERVAQVYHGKGLMTPFKGILKDAEIVAVAKYLGDMRK